MEIDDKLKGEITNALKYCESLLKNENLLTNKPPEEISSSSIAMGEEFFNSIVNMLEERKIIEEEELIIPEEIDELQEYVDCTGLPDDDDNFVAQEFTAAPFEYIPLWYKEKAIAVAAVHPKWGLKSLQTHGLARLKHKEHLYRWKEDVKRGGTHFDKWYSIDHETYERFVEARMNMEQVSTRTLQQWAMNAAFPFLSDNFNFVASKAWVERFKKKNKIRQRKITKYVSHAEFATIEEILAAAERFQMQTKILIRNYDPNFVINTDQIGCQYQSTYNRTLAAQESKTVSVTKRNLNNITHYYMAQYTLTASGKILPFVFLCMREPSGKFGPNVQKKVDELSNKFKNVVVTCTKSGKFTKEIYKTFLQTVVVPYAQKNNFILIIDSWGGQTDLTLHDSIFEDETGATTCTLKIIPPKCTPLCQPCDVYFYWQIKIFIKKIQNAPDLLKEQREIATREDAIKIHSLILHQLSAPDFIPMIQYAWFASKLTEERTIFLNVNDLCFPVSLLKKPCACKNVAFIKCAWCSKNLCFSCFYDKYHPETCSV